MSQLFGLHLPVDITHLQALLSLIYHSLDTYLQRVFDQLGIDQLYIFLTVVTVLALPKYACKLISLMSIPRDTCLRRGLYVSGRLYAAYRFYYCVSLYETFLRLTF